MLQQLIDTLKKTYQTTRKEEICQAEETLKTISTTQGYIPHLLTIVNSDQPDHNLTLAALAQLKNFLRKAWPRTG